MEELLSADNSRLIYNIIKETILDIKPDEFLYWLANKSNLERFIRNNIHDSNTLLANSYIDHFYKKYPSNSISDYKRYNPIKDKKVIKNLIESRKKDQLYEDIDRNEERGYKSRELGLVVTNNINMKREYIYVDSIFNYENSNSRIKIVLTNNENPEFHMKSTSLNIKNIKGFTVKEIFAPEPTNLTLNTDDIIKLDVMEFSSFTHREPNVNYMFPLKVEAYGSRFRFIPIDDFYYINDWISVIQTLTFRFLYQTKELEFPTVGVNATITGFANPTNINSPGHDLNTGDKIVIYNYTGDKSDEINTLHEIIKSGTNNFTIPVDLDGFTGSPYITYYEISKKIEFLIEFLCI